MRRARGQSGGGGSGQRAMRREGRREGPGRAVGERGGAHRLMPDQPRDEGRLEAVGGEAEARALAPETGHRQLGERRPRLLLHLLEGGRGGADLCELVAARLGGGLLALLLVLPRALAVALIDRALRLALGAKVLVACAQGAAPRSVNSPPGIKGRRGGGAPAGAELALRMPSARLEPLPVSEATTFSLSSAPSCAAQVRGAHPHSPAASPLASGAARRTLTAASGRRRPRGAGRRCERGHSRLGVLRHIRARVRLSDSCPPSTRRAAARTSGTPAASYW